MAGKYRLEVFTGNEPLPELIFNPQVAGPKCIK